MSSGRRVLACAAVVMTLAGCTPAQQREEDDVRLPDEASAVLKVDAVLEMAIAGLTGVPSESVRRQEGVSRLSCDESSDQLTRFAEVGTSAGDDVQAALDDVTEHIAGATGWRTSITSSLADGSPIVSAGSDSDLSGVVVAQEGARGLRITAYSPCFTREG